MRSVGHPQASWIQLPNDTGNKTVFRPAVLKSNYYSACRIKLQHSTIPSGNRSLWLLESTWQKLAALMRFSLFLAGVIGITDAFILNGPSSNERCASKDRTFAFGNSGCIRNSPLQATAISTNAELVPGIDAIDNANEDIRAQLNTLRQKPYFRLYSVDILASCEYMPQELFECYSETCEIYPIDDDEVRQPQRRTLDSTIRVCP